MNILDVSTEAAQSKVAQLDFEAIRFKLMHDPKCLWTASQALSAEKEYRRFLVLTVLFPDQRLVPTQEVDEFWHHHILDTRAYSRDCQQALGFFLHHWPYSGVNGPEDAEEFRRNRQTTAEIFRSVFGEEYKNSMSRCDSSCSTDSDGPSCDASGYAVQESEFVRPRFFIKAVSLN